jgi:hypothetical protein
VAKKGRVKPGPVPKNTTKTNSKKDSRLKDRVGPKKNKK